MFWTIIYCYKTKFLYYNNNNNFNISLKLSCLGHNLSHLVVFQYISVGQFNLWEKLSKRFILYGILYGMARWPENFFLHISVAMSRQPLGKFNFWAKDYLDMVAVAWLNNPKTLFLCIYRSVSSTFEKSWTKDSLDMVAVAWQNDPKTLFFIEK